MPGPIIWGGKRLSHRCAGKTAGRAGLSVYMDEAHHYDLTITPDGEGGFQGEVRLRIGPLTQVVGSRKFAGSRV